MNKIVSRIIMLGLCIVGISATSMAQSTITAVDPSIFPKAEKGYKQMLITVPYSDTDDSKKIEFSVGKFMEVDGCNHFSLQGELVKTALTGWGYDYYTFKTNGNVIGTMMGCEGVPSRNIFVSAQPEVTRYNGQLPIVVYVPEEYDVQFKVYKAEPENYRASEYKAKK